MAGQREYQRLVEEVAVLLGAPATLEDRDFVLVAFAAHEGDLAADDVRARSILSRRSAPQVKAWFEGFGITRATGPVRIPADPDTGVRARLCLPARHRGVTYGYIWLLDPGADTWPAEDLDAAFALAGRAGDLLAEEAHAGAELGDLLRDLVHGVDEARAAAVLEAAAAGMGGSGALYALAVLHDSPAALPDPLSVHAMSHVVAAYADEAGRGELVALIRSARPAAETARRIAKGRRSARAGVSSDVRDLASAGQLLEQARAAARTAAAFPERAPVAAWAELGPYRLLARLPAADPAVAPLLAPQHAELARTAEVYLDHAAHATQAAGLLAIHRQTLYYRLSRVEELTGLDLGNGEHRLLLHMALKAARLNTPPPGAAPRERRP
ncbi:PucR family transcriptional regulator [Yinghuangia soli]|uniref:Helix-turn-helix domain-containing protein n=1 Tax=Yinghuangia soli TaxID=2908204 RepID=A0AA41PYS0_9ACTN|nr:helix-turn-helix domain-containing protein [Yinghuangia soli]MCF2528146.1 helix-turn-helix domain-containing protein [Yinghuangia soli]